MLINKCLDFSAFSGILKWQNRVWLTVTQFNQARQNDSIAVVSADTNIEYKRHEIFLFEKRNYLTNRATYSFKCSHQLNNSIKQLQALTDALRVGKDFVRLNLNLN